MRSSLTVATAMLALSAGALAHARTPGQGSGVRVTPQAIAVHERAITLDSHLDTPASLAIDGWSIADAHDVASDFTQVDLPRLKAGGLDGGFWVVYTAQGPLDAVSTIKARDFALMRAVAIREMVAAHPNDFALATSAADAARIAAQGKRIVYMSIENAWPLGDPSMLGAFHALGVRLAGITHFANNQFGDSSTDPAGEKWGGLSPAGVELLAEMNRLGIVPDVSHASDKVLDDVLRLSKTPVLLSHSGCKAIYDHPRNVDDARLKALAAKGGVIQMNSLGSYLRARQPNPERTAALRALAAKYGPEREMTAERRAAMLAERRAIDQRLPETDRASFDDFMKHLLHALKLVGVDHVGIGLDLDGGGGTIGLEDVSDVPVITAALLKAGYTEADVKKIWSGNVLRVLGAAEAAAAS